MAPFLSAGLDDFVERHRVQFKPSYPVNMEEIILSHSLLSVEPIADLTVERTHKWLTQRGACMTIQDYGVNRSLFGCLVVDSATERGYIFVERDCHESQQRFTLAHEFAHYLYDYQRPRQHALTRYGETIRNVLDGKRIPTTEERVDALLQNVPIRIYQHLMWRTPDRQIIALETEDSETRADQIALELLAAHRHVISQVGARLTPEALRDELIPILQTRYGLPETIVRRYAVQLSGFYGVRPGIRSWFR